LYNQKQFVRLMSQEYDSVVSIGSWCCVAQQLRGRDLRKLSYPFDWIFGNLEIVRASVKEPFTVLNEFRDKLNTDFECEPYRVVSFPHHTLENAKDAARLESACIPWQTLLASRQRVLLVHTPRPHQSIDSVVEKITLLLQEIRGQNDKLDVSALVLFHQPWDSTSSVDGVDKKRKPAVTLGGDETPRNFIERHLRTDDIEVIVAHVSHEWESANWDGRDHGALWEEVFENIKLKK